MTSPGKREIPFSIQWSVNSGMRASMHSIFSFISSAGDAESADALLGAFEAMIAGYGLHYYKVSKPPARSGDAGRVLACRLPPGWQAIYDERKYARIDPVRKKLANAQHPFRWSEAVADARPDPHYRRMESVLAEAAEYGLQDGHAFPVHGRKGLHGTVVVSGPGGELSDGQVILLDTAARVLFWRLLDLNGEADETADPAHMPDTTMTRREMDVLFLLADGMTSHEIARTLEISNHTVDWYINGIQEKMNARNRQHVVAIAFRHGLIF